MFKPPTPVEPATRPEQTTVSAAPTEPNWCKAKSLLREVVGQEGYNRLGPLEKSIHQLHVQFELVHHELEEAKVELATKKKKRKK